MWWHGVPDALNTPVLIPSERGGEMDPRGHEGQEDARARVFRLPARVSQFIIYYYLIFHQIRS